MPWLDAYATDFLIRAKEHGKNVPDFAINGRRFGSHDYVRQEHTEIGELPALAYAHYVLARAKSDDLDGLRYFYETQMARLPTELAKAQTAAALAQYGDMARAAAAYEPPWSPACRGRPRSAMLITAASCAIAPRCCRSPPPIPGNQARLTAVIDRIAERFSRAARTSTQEQAWLLMAAEAAAKSSGGAMTVATDNGAPQSRSEPFICAGFSVPAARQWQSPIAAIRRLGARVDHRGAGRRFAGREQRLCGEPQRVSAGRHGGGSEQGAADGFVRRRPQGHS